MHSWRKAKSYQLSAVLSILRKTPLSRGAGGVFFVNQVSFFSFSLMKKKQKIKTWDFRRSKWAHFLKLKNSLAEAGQTVRVSLRSRNFGISFLSRRLGTPAKSYGRKSLRRYYYGYWNSKIKNQNSLIVNPICAFVAISWKLSANSRS